MPSSSQSPPVPAGDPDDAAARRFAGHGQRLSRLCRLGGVALVLAVALAATVGWSAAVVLVPVGCFVLAVAGAARAFQRAASARIADLETARRHALATAMSKAQFLANMSHEIRTPMNGILGMAELLVRTRLDAEQEQMASTIQASADALLAVLNDILDYSKIEAGKLELETADFDLWQMVDDCAGLLHNTADQKGVELLTYVDPRLLRCHRGDPARLRQVVLNFLSNAVKFTLEGEVQLSAELVEQLPDAQRITVSVRDTGIGIAEAAMERLFAPFAQADASTTRRFGGTGLGLAICRRLVEMMGGAIVANSTPGAGSTFSFELLLPHGDLAKARSGAADVDLSAHSLLVVDDNETSRRIVALQLTPTRIGIGFASNAISALSVLRDAAARGKPFTMAILDMTMPGFDGLQLAEVIRNDPQVPPLVVTLASSLGTRPDLAQMAAGDVFRWLNKPLGAVRLLQTVQDMACCRSGAPRRAARRGPVETSPPAVAPGLRVLVAEDNEVNRRVLAGMLRRIGCEAEFAVDGREAVQLALRGGFGLVLMDCQMPELDGFQATQAIRAAGGACAALPIVALTANALASDREACLAAGMDDFVSKPVKLDVLRAAVQRWSAREPVAAGDQRS